MDAEYATLVQYFARLYDGRTMGAAFADGYASQRRVGGLIGLLASSKRDAEEWSSLARDHRVAAGRVLEAAAAAGISEDDVTEMANVMGTERAALAELIAAEVKRPA